MSARLHRPEPTLRKETTGYTIVEGVRVEPARWRVLLERLHGLVFKADYEPTEIYLATGTLVISVILLLPMRTFPTSPAYGPLALLATEEDWGLGTLALALVAYAAWGRETFALRLVGLFFHVVWYTFVGLMLAIGNPAGLGPFFVVAGVWSAWAFCRLAVRWDREAGERTKRFIERSIDAWDDAEHWARRTQMRTRLRVRGLRRALSRRRT